MTDREVTVTVSEKTKLEMERGRYMTVMENFRKEFDPDYEAPAGIPREERARRDEYRKRMQSQGYPK
jgi:hypothetical protein